MSTVLPMNAEVPALLRLQTWLSPAFPTGGFSYSHGLEFAVEAGLVTDAETTARWARTVLLFGAGRTDGILLAAAWRAETVSDRRAIVELGAALRGTAELATESTQQGAAFLRAVRTAWSHPVLDEWMRRFDREGLEPVLPVAVGLVCAVNRIGLETVLPLYLQAFAASLVSAAVRLVPLGQSDGLHILALLEPPVMEAARAAETASLADIGSATPMVDWASMKHETQYTRLFRS